MFYQKKILLLMLFVAFGSGCTRCHNRKTARKLSSQSTESQSVLPERSGKVRFRFANLEKNTLARSGSLEVKSSEMVDVILESLLKKREEIEFALAYQQWLSNDGQPSKNVESRELASSGEEGSFAIFHMSAPSRSIASILNQFGIPKREDVLVRFEKAEGDSRFLSWQGKEFRREDLDTNNIYWAGNESDIFRRHLAIIEKRIKQGALLDRAKQENLSVSEYKKKFVFEGKEYSSSEQEKRLNYYLEKYVLDLPILVGVPSPQFDFDLRYDWTPSLGPVDAKLKVVVMADFFSQASKNLIKEIEGLSKAFPEVYFGFRPIFSEGDRYQVMLSDMALCSWSQEPDKFWSFLPTLSAAKKDTLEEDVFRAIEQQGMDLESMKACFFSRKHKEAVEYHLKYAEYLKVKSFPTVFVGGEAFVGAVHKNQIEEAIGRVLEIPTAAVW